MSKGKSFWEQIFESISCCSSREKDKAYTGEKERSDHKENDKAKSKGKASKELEDEAEPGSVFLDIDLREDSVYAMGAYDDGSIEIR